MEAIILAGGFGKRLRKVVKDVPKPMAKIGSIPFLEIIIKKLKRSGFKHIILSLGYLSEQISSYFGSNYENIEISYSFEEHPLGTGGAIKKAIEKVKNNYFYVFNGDTYLDLEIEELDMRFCQTENHIIVGKLLDDVSRYGMIFSENGLVKRFNEKRSEGSGIINAGCYVFRKDIIKQLPSKNNFSLEYDFLPNLINQEKVILFISQGEFIDIGTPEDYKKAQKILSNL